MAEHISKSALMVQMYRACEVRKIEPGDISQGARMLRLAAFQLGKIAEMECNGIVRWDSKARMRLASWTDADQARADRLTARHEKRARDAMAVAFGPDWERQFAISFQGDPRGAPIGIHRADADQNGGIYYGHPIISVY